MPNIKIRKNETKQMKCGMKATIIKYRNVHDIDIKFEDGTIVKHRYYKSFKVGEILHPKYTSEEKAKKRIGERRVMNCGIKATIVSYRRSDDIDIEFEDGVVVAHRKYREFTIGEILHPKFNSKEKAENRLGETRIMNCGSKATIKEYRGCMDIDVKFEDGTIVAHRTYNSFKKGKIKNPKAEINERVGETRIMNCGLKATIKKYRNSKDIDLRFEDGIVVKNRSYYNFTKGKIGHPKTKESSC